MGINGPKRVWVGVSQGVIGDLRVEVASTLKGLCDMTGVSYGTAVGKKVDGGFLIVGGNLDTLRSWWFVEKVVRKVVGRGNLGK